MGGGESWSEMAPRLREIVKGYAERYYEGRQNSEEGLPSLIEAILTTAKNNYRASSEHLLKMENGPRVLIRKMAQEQVASMGSELNAEFASADVASFAAQAIMSYRKEQASLLGRVSRGLKK